MNDPQMFNPKKPNNQLPLLPTDFNYDNVAILKQVNLSNIALAKVNALAGRLPDSILLVSPLLVRESVASSQIENINTTVFEVFEAEVMSEKKKGPAKEVLNYRDAIFAGLDLVKKRGILTTNDFVKIQSIVEPNKHGIRKLGVKIMNDLTKEILYTPPEGETHIRDFLANVEEFINKDDDGIDPLVKSAVFHYQFESIHPFLDGNGRVGRILIILYLIMAKRLDLPVLFLSGYIMKHKKSYYECLHKANSKGDLLDVIMFMLRAIEEQAEATVITIQKIEVLMNKFKSVLAKKTVFYSHELIQLLFSKPFMTIDYLQGNMGFSARQTASKYLTEMVKLGLFQSKKIGKSKFFYSKEFLKLLS
ncbi:MAG: Fic/DOC family N-terminal domain-containing protein [Candidatus Peregrinibacteria bacterium]|nr:Fic/DOC family N-terminal domain-containing protein [Candidatus Peregrinibacteria bacterium]